MAKTKEQNNTFADIVAAMMKPLAREAKKRGNKGLAKILTKTSNILNDNENGEQKIKKHKRTKHAGKQRGETSETIS